MQKHGGCVFGSIGVVLTDISGGDPLGKVRNAGSFFFGRGGRRISDSQRAVMNGSGITGHQQLGGRWSPDPLWQPATLARPLPPSPRPHLLPAPVGKWKVSSITSIWLFTRDDVLVGDHLVWSTLWGIVSWCDLSQIRAYINKFVVLPPFVLTVFLHFLHTGLLYIWSSVAEPLALDCRCSHFWKQVLHRGASGSVSSAMVWHHDINKSEYRHCHNIIFFSSH